MHPDEKALFDETVAFQKCLDTMTIEDTFVLVYTPLIDKVMRENYGHWCPGCDPSYGMVSPDPSEHTCGQPSCDFFQKDRPYLVYTTIDQQRRAWAKFMEKVGKTEVLRTSILGWLSYFISVQEMIEENAPQICDLLKKHHNTIINPDFVLFSELSG